MPIDKEKLRALQWSIMENVSACAILPLMRIGDELGLFNALAEKGPCSSAVLADTAKIDERYGLEWLYAMCAAGYCSHDETFERFFLSDEQKAVFAYEDSPSLMIGAYDVLAGNVHGIEKVMAAFKSGDGVDYGQFHPCVFKGTARFFKPSYETNLIQKWIPKIPEVEKILQEGGRLCDVGCGKGLSTMLLASEYTSSEFVGYDIHEPSIGEANSEAIRCNLTDRLRYCVGDAESYDGVYDIITFFDCLHDMGDPLGAAKYAHSKLSDSGWVVLIEPSAGDDVSQNMHKIGQMYYAFSTMGCVPTSKSQKVAAALGAQAGPARLSEIMLKAGFNSSEIVFKNSTNMVMAFKS
ncbi:MAG: hypothetical protein CML56_09205 [Rhodobacteraceae bacterium]|nr:hypothetical protein [Paracoccaceae bacterium]